MPPRQAQTNNSGKLHGQNLPWDIDPDLDDAASQAKPSDSLFPDIQLPYAEPPTAHEKYIVARYRQIRSAHRNGPFFAELDENAVAPPSGKRSPRAAHFDPFDDPGTYTKKHLAKPRTLPDLSQVKIDKQFLPKELWIAVDSDFKSDAPPRKKKKLGLSEKLEKLADHDDGNEADVTAARPLNEDGEQQDAQEVEVDDEFDEDDEDLDDDYNAEKYFSGGEEDEADVDAGED